MAFIKPSFGSMRGKRSGPVIIIFRYLSRMKHNIFVMVMNEYLTPQVCAILIQSIYPIVEP
jgi:hypothetical protein